MGQRGLPNRGEILAVMRLLADVTSLKGAPAAQRQLLVDGLARQFRAPLAWLLVLDGARPDRPLVPLVAVLPADTDPFWLRYTATFNAHVPASADPFAAHILPCPDADQQWTRRRVLPDAAALRRHAAAAQLIDEAGVGDGVVHAARMPGDRLVSLSLHRTAADPAMTDRDHGLQRFAVAEVRRLLERGHLVLGPPAGLPQLTPRLRQVLDGIKVGHSPKGIARGLGLSVWTVRDHIKALYAKFDVRGRDELMARFIDDDGG